MKQQEFYGEIELLNNKKFEGKFIINESGKFKHLGSGYIFKEEHILLKREFEEDEEQFGVILFIIIMFLLLVLMITTYFTF